MKPILFNTEMVRAILDGRKTITRRVIKFPLGLTGSHVVGEAGNPDNPLGLMWACGIKRPPYQPGDILYVRETFFKDISRYMYKADYSENEKFYRAGKEVSMKWRPSIHMPKEAARIFLRVTAVRAERLQDITANDCEKEGLKVTGDGDGEVANQFVKAVFDTKVWGNTIKKSDLNRYGWNANPWVWVIEFERISREKAMANGIS